MDFLEATKIALDLLYRDDPYLIVNDAHERSITHRLALHLERVVKHPQFPVRNLKVDCEYDLRGTSNKKEVPTPTNPDGSPAYPDIIVHRRNGENFLIIEAKSKKSSWDSDFRKLLFFATDENYQYPLAIFLDIHSDHTIVVTWKSGQESEPIIHKPRIVSELFQ